MMQDLSTGGCPNMFRWNPWWAHRMHLWPCWLMWFSLQWKEGRNIQYHFVCALSDSDLVHKLLALKLTATTSKMLELCHMHITISDNMNAMGLTGSKTVNAICHQKQQCQWQQPQQQKSHTASTAQHTCSNWTKSHAPGRSSCPAKDSMCSGCGHTGHWQIHCRNSGGPQATKKPEGTKKKQGGCCCNHWHCGYRQTDVVDIGADPNPQLNEVSMAGVTLQHGHEWLGTDPEYITIADIKTNMRTEAFTTVDWEGYTAR